MNIQILSPRRREAGYTLALVVTFSAISLLALASALDWVATNTRLNHRNNQYQTTVAAAEAATEKVLAGLERDFQVQGENLVYGNLGNYRLGVPTSGEHGWWNEFAFTDPFGNDNRTYVQRLSAASFVPLESQYRGIYGLASRYRVISNTRMLNASHDLTVGVKQEVQLAAIPLFQFAIFYSMDLEINPSPNMKVTGRVHGNANIYTQPHNTLQFMNDVTAVGEIIPDKHPLDPSVRPSTNQRIIFDGQHDGGVSSLTLPVGTNNSSEAVHAIVEVPPGNENPASAMGRERFFNKADLVILVTNSAVTVRTGTNYTPHTVPKAQWTNFLSTNVVFTNKREVKTIRATEVDVGRLKSWTETNSALRSILGGRDVNSIFVADQRTVASGYESGVRIKNGQTLPSRGLTVASPNPLYVWGNYNAPAAHQGSTNTSQTKPAALIGDAITVLSTDWTDADSNLGLSYRKAGNTTVNAAFMGGLVESGGGYYSGGVENFPRFLEDWSSRTLTYNGSMVVMFRSQTATGKWGTGDVYSPPTRNWAFDLNFMDAAKLPPGTPMLRALIRGQWATVAPRTTE